MQNSAPNMFRIYRLRHRRLGFSKTETLKSCRTKKLTVFILRNHKHSNVQRSTGQTIHHNSETVISTICYLLATNIRAQPPTTHQSRCCYGCCRLTRGALPLDLYLLVARPLASTGLLTQSHGDSSLPIYPASFGPDCLRVAAGCPAIFRWCFAVGHRTSGSTIPARWD